MNIQHGCEEETGQNQMGSGVFKCNLYCVLDIVCFLRQNNLQRLGEWLSPS